MRFHDWQSKLAEVIESRHKTPFSWGQQDCCMFAADCVWAMTGSDPAFDVRGQYSDADGAARLLAKFGGVVALAEDRLGAEVPPRCASIGDIGVVESEGRECLAVNNGTLRWLVPGEHGLVLFGHALRAWRPI